MAGLSFASWRRRRGPAVRSSHGRRAEPHRDLLGLIACPKTRRPLQFDARRSMLVEPIGETAYAIRDGIPILLAPLADEGDCGTPSPDRAGSFSHSYDEIIQSPRMKALYGGSGYFNVGHWERSPVCLRDACDAMMDELAAGIAEDARVVLDVGCGVGAGTVRLIAARPEAIVVGVNISPWQLSEARNRGLVHAVASDAARLSFADDVADCIVACESPQHFDTREDFLREALRVLKPGGTIAIADMLFQDREPAGSWMLPAANRATTPLEYRHLLGSAGFHEATVRDVTELTWAPYCREMQRIFEGQEAQLKRIAESLARYVIAFARKPGRPRSRRKSEGSGVPASLASALAERRSFEGVSASLLFP